MAWNFIQVSVLLDMSNDNGLAQSLFVLLWGLARACLFIGEDACIEAVYE